MQSTHLRTRRAGRSASGWFDLGILSAVLSCVVVCGCSSGVLEPPVVPLTEPMELCSAAQPIQCRPTEQVEIDLRKRPLAILQASDTPGGSQGAKVLTFKTGYRVLRAKWRPASSGDLINEPRKELAAYAVNKMLAGSWDRVVPPTAARCLPVERYREVVDESARPEPGTSCVLGYLSYWLPHAMDVEEARDEDLLSGGKGLLDVRRVRSDPVYRTAVGHLNLLTYTIHHGDAHAGQFMLVEGREGLAVYSVDNSVAFRSIKNPALLWRRDWSRWLMPDITQDQVERLRSLSAADYAMLRVVQQLENREGILVDSDVGPPTGDSGQAVRRDGGTLQIGLTEGEIDGVRNRVETLLERIDRGEIRQVGLRG